MPQRHEIEPILDRLCRAKANALRADIDAATCGTRHDWNRAKEAEDAYHEAYEKAVKELIALSRNP